MDKFAPYKHKNVRYNNNPFMTKKTTKERNCGNDPNYELNLINLEGQKTGKNTISKEASLSILKGTRPIILIT